MCVTSVAINKEDERRKVAMSVKRKIEDKWDFLSFQLYTLCRQETVHFIYMIILILVQKLIA